MVLTQLPLILTRSLEDFRNDRYLTVGEFARVLGISEQTYRRVLTQDLRVTNPTKRQIAERLGVPPHVIAELIPPVSAAYLRRLNDVILESNARGWYVADPESGLPTDRREQVTCPPLDLATE